MPQPTTDHETIRDQVRTRYAQAALQVSSTCCTPAAGTCCADDPTDAVFGAALYEGQTEGLPVAAVQASLGCGNPVLVAELHPGERVLDLGSGGGIDVLLAARQVGPDGFVHGVDMTPEMLALARRNATEAGATNVEFHQGTIEHLPLGDGTVDVVISNCVINLAADKRTVLDEAYRVLVPGGRFRVSDVVAEDHLSPAQRLERGEFTGCIAGALSRTEYLQALTAAGFTDAHVEFTHQVADAMHGAVIRATRPR